MSATLAGVRTLAHSYGWSDKRIDRLMLDVKRSWRVALDLGPRAKVDEGRVARAAYSRLVGTYLRER